MKDNMKESIKAKGAAVKAKLKGMKDKAKGAKKCAVILAFALCGELLCGCGTNPASRMNSNAFDDVEPTVKVVLGENASSNVVNVTLNNTIGDGVLASADSAGSSETQTATPTYTTDVKPDLDLHYNDALSAGASVAASGATAAKGVAEAAKDDTAKNLTDTLKDKGKELLSDAANAAKEN